jgi:hypothetical protein
MPDLILLTPLVLTPLVLTPPALSYYSDVRNPNLEKSEIEKCLPETKVIACVWVGESFVFRGGTFGFRTEQQENTPVK